MSMVHFGLQLEFPRGKPQRDLSISRVLSEPSHYDEAVVVVRYLLLVEQQVAHFFAQPLVK